MTRGYSENELVQNRAAVLLFGGREEERRAWAEEAARNFGSEGPLRVAGTVEELKAALVSPRGVVFVPDALKAGEEGQALILKALHQEERPKLVVGVPGSVGAALAEGKLRDDLHYRLQLGKLDLGPNELREAIRARRQAAQKLAEKVAAASQKAAAASQQPASARRKPAAKSVSKAKPSTAKKAPKNAKRAAHRPARPIAKKAPPKRAKR